MTHPQGCAGPEDPLTWREALAQSLRERMERQEGRMVRVGREKAGAEQARGREGQNHMWWAGSGLEWSWVERPWN